MGYPTVDAPYGLKPVNLLGGLPFAGAVRHIPIASAYATALFNGDLVTVAGNGTCEADAAAANPVGVFLGCSYTNPSTKQKLFNQQWPARTVAPDAMAMVADDPNTLFKAVYVSGTTVVTGATRDMLGSNCAVQANAGNVATGNSKGAVKGGGATSGPLRIVDVVEDTRKADGTYPEVIVKLTAHAYNNATGIALAEADKKKADEAKLKAELQVEVELELKEEAKAEAAAKAAEADAAKEKAKAELKEKMKAEAKKGEKDAKAETPKTAAPAAAGKKE